MELADYFDNLTEHCRRWAPDQRFKQQSADSDIVSAVFALYESLACDLPPRIIICDSPWQMFVGNAALEYGFDQVAPFAEDGDKPDPNLLWQALFRTLDAQISGDDRDLLYEQAGPMRTKRSEFAEWKSYETVPQSGSWFGLEQTILERLIRLNGDFRAAAHDYFGDAGYNDLANCYSRQVGIERVGLDFLPTEIMERSRRYYRDISSRVLAVFDRMRDPAFVMGPEFSDLQLGWGDLVPRFLESYDHIAAGKREQFEFTLACREARTSSIMAEPWWLPFYDYLAQRTDIAFQSSDLKFMRALLAVYAVTPCFMPFAGLCLLSRTPSTLHLDDIDRLHCESGPAVSFADGFAGYAWHGVVVPYNVIEKPLQISVQAILSETNVEVRRVMIERYGLGRFVHDSGAPIHEDEYGILYRLELPGEDTIVLVKVVNSTPEKDGSTREYFLRVPPGVNTARAAVAWTFGMQEGEYEPTIES